MPKGEPRRILPLDSRWSNRERYWYYQYLMAGIYGPAMEIMARRLPKDVIAEKQAKLARFKAI